MLSQGSRQLVTLHEQITFAKSQLRFDLLYNRAQIGSVGPRRCATHSDLSSVPTALSFLTTAASTVELLCKGTTWLHAEGKQKAEAA